MTLQELAPYVAIVVSLLSVLGTLIYVGRTIGKAEQRIDSMEHSLTAHEAKRGHEGCLALVTELRERTIVLEQGHVHAKSSLDSLTSEVKEFRADLKEAMNEVRRDMQKLLERGTTERPERGGRG